MNFTTMAEAAKSINEKNDCAVKALALAAEIPYHEAHSLLRKHGRRHGGRTKWHVFFEAAKEINLELIDVPGNLGHKTIRTWGRRRYKGTYLIATRGHVLCSKDGVVEDWTNERCHRILKIWKVVRSDKPVSIQVQPEIVVPVKPKKRKDQPSAKFTICSMWRINPKKTLQDAEELAEEYGVKYSTVKGWISEWSKGKNFPTR